MYYAEIDQNNIVLRVLVADQAFINTLSGTWVQTDISGVSPINFAGKGFTYSPERNAFISPKPFNSWTLNETTCTWEAPVAKPNTASRYGWNETTLSWDLEL